MHEAEHALPPGAHVKADVAPGSLGLFWALGLSKLNDTFVLLPLLGGSCPHASSTALTSS